MGVMGDHAQLKTVLRLNQRPNVRVKPPNVKFKPVGATDVGWKEGVSTLRARSGTNERSNCGSVDEPRKSGPMHNWHRISAPEGHKLTWLSKILTDSGPVRP